MSHDRAWWDLGRASSDVIEGHCSKHSRHLTGFQALGKHIWGICASYFVEIGQDFQMKEVYHLAIQHGVYLRLARLQCIYIFLISKCGSPVGRTASHDRQFSGPFGLKRSKPWVKS